MASAQIYVAGMETKGAIVLTGIRTLYFGHLGTVRGVLIRGGGGGNPSTPPPPPPPLPSV